MGWEVMPGSEWTIGAEWSGKMPGSGGMLPVWSRMARASARVAGWPFVIEYRLHTAQPSLAVATAPSSYAVGRRHFLREQRFPTFRRALA